MQSRKRSIPTGMRWIDATLTSPTRASGIFTRPTFSFIGGHTVQDATLQATLKPRDSSSFRHQLCFAALPAECSPFN